MEQVERKIEQLKLAMRFAQGDAQKLAALAREAALLAREAGRAAKEYGAGIKAAAELGLPGDSAAAAGGTMLSSETTITRSTTSLTLQQTELTLTIDISTGEGEPAQTAAQSAAQSAAEATADLMASGAAADTGSAARTAAQDGALPDDIARLVEDVLSGLGAGGLTGAGRGAGGASVSHGPMIQQMMADNAMKMSRYREADAFGQRVEGVLATSKRIIGEAKAANMLDESEKRRRERREGFKADDKLVEVAQKEVNALRAAAFGSSEALGVAGLLGGGDADAAESPLGSTSAASAAQPAAALDLLA